MGAFECGARFAESLSLFGFGMGSGGKKGNGGVRRIVRKPFEVEVLANGPKVECEIDSLASPDDERVAPDVVILLHGQWSSGYGKGRTPPRDAGRVRDLD